MDGRLRMGALDSHIIAFDRKKAAKISLIAIVPHFLSSLLSGKHSERRVEGASVDGHLYSEAVKCI